MNHISVNPTEQKQPLAVKLKGLAGYLVASLLCVLLLFPLLKLDHADLKTPFYYQGDVLYYATMIKGLMENNWYFQNSKVGVPSGLFMYDALNSDNLNYLVIKVISFFSPNYAAAMNIYFLLTFLLTTLCALAVLRKFQLNYPISLLMALLYTFLPYHFWRGEIHLFLAAYYMVPLSVLLVFQVLEDQRLTIRSFLICIFTASSVVYYGFFTCFFLVIAGVALFIKTRQYKSFVKAAVLITCIIVVTLLNLSPTLFYQAQKGPNPESAVRTPGETEIYGLKIIQLLLPIPRHKVKMLADLNSQYTRNAPLINENQFSALGLMASVGFLILIFQVIYIALRRCETPGPSRASPLDFLGVLNLLAILLASTGGFGPVFALIYPKFRSMNRMSIYIAFFSLLAVGILLQKFYQRLEGSKIKRGLFYVVLVLLLGVGLMDQTNPQMVPDYHWSRVMAESDHDFFKQIEKQMPQGAMIFQLPYIPFPEESFKGIYPYDHFRAYLNTQGLRWSYGAMKGRSGDAWQRQMMRLSLDEFLERLAFNGFRGIYLNQIGLDDDIKGKKIDPVTLKALNILGFPEGGENLKQKLEEKLQCKPLMNEDCTLFFFNMENYISNLEKKYSPMEKQAMINRYKFTE